MITSNVSIEQVLQENEVLKRKIKELEDKLQQQTITNQTTTQTNDNVNETDDLKYIPSPATGSVFTQDQITRYGRQLIMSEIGTKGQQKLIKASVLIVGTGGLGSPSSFYLAGAGIGKIGLVDFDTVEMSNLHRQIIHKESSVGVPKVESAKNTLFQYNSSVEYKMYTELFTSANAMEIIKEYDIVLDCTDNVPTRYLLNDCCVLQNKPLVSGAALRMDGQVTVYHYKGGPCYRCLFPKPPPPETVTDCSNGGVLGVVPGVIGCIQALEAIKIAADIGEVLSEKMLLFDAMACSFRQFKLRKRNPDCTVCGDNPTITHPIDYEMFCRSKATDKPSTKTLLESEYHITCTEYNNIRNRNEKHILLDVREPIQYEICNLPNSLNIPLRQLSTRLDELRSAMSFNDLTIYVICRRGNDSQKAVQILEDKGFKKTKNVMGGVSQWSREVDPSFPIY